MCDAHIFFCVCRDGGETRDVEFCGTYLWYASRGASLIFAALLRSVRDVALHLIRHFCDEWRIMVSSPMGPSPIPEERPQFEVALVEVSVGRIRDVVTRTHTLDFIVGGAH